MRPLLVIFCFILAHLGRPEALAAQIIPIEGRVLTADETPVEGARAELLPLLTTYERWRLELDGEGPPEAVDTALSDADGVFFLHAPGLGPWRVVVSAPGSLPSTVDVGATATQTVLSDVVLGDGKTVPGDATAGRSVVVEVRKTEGAAVAGAIVVADGRPLGRTETDGRVRVVWPSGTTLRLQVLTADEIYHAPFRQRPPEGETLVVELSPPHFVEGRVVDAENGAPIEGALVGNGDVGFARTDRKGFYRLSTTGYPSTLTTFTAAEYLPVELEEGKIQPVQELQPAAVTAGVVVDGEGLPVRGAEVWIHRLRKLAHVSPEGRFHVLHRRAPDWMLVRAPGFAGAYLAIGPYSAPGLRVVLARGRRVFGRVVDPEGSPLSGVALGLFPVGFFGHEERSFTFERDPNVRVERPLPTPTFATTSGGDGRFEIPAVYAGEFDLALRRDGFARQSLLGIEVIDTADVDLGDVLLEPGASVSGRVVDDAGAPVAQAEVSTFDWDSLWIHLDQRRDGETKSDAEGRFQLDHMPQRELSLDVSHEDYFPSYVESVLPPAEDLVLEIRRGVRVSGRVIDESGHGVAHAYVSGGGAVDEDGYFDGLSEPGEIRLQARSREGDKVSEPLLIEATPGEKVTGIELVVVSREQVVLEGRVTDPAGEPVVGVSVDIEDAAEKRLGGAGTDGDGRYRIVGVPPGTCRVSVGQPPGTHREIEVRPGVQVLDFVLAVFSVEGRVVAPSGEPLAGAVVRAYSSGRTTISSAEGTFRFAPTTPGLYIFTADLEGFAPGSTRAVVVDADVRGLEIVLPPALRLRGQVLNVDPADLSRVRISAWSGSSSPRPSVEGHPNLNGTYHLDGLGPGVWEVTASLDDRYVLATATLEPESGDATLDLVFAAAGLTLSVVVLVDGQPPGEVEGVLALGIDVNHRALGRRVGDGSFRVEGLKPGRYLVATNVISESGNYLGTEETVDLVEDQEVRLEVHTTAVAGRVVDPDGQPVGGARIVFKPRHGFQTLPVTVRSSPDGRFDSPRLTAGAYALAVLHEGFTTTSLELELEPGTRLDDLEVTLVPGTELVLEVDAVGVPRPEWVSVGDEGSSRQVVHRVRLGNDGRGRVDHVRGGENWLLIAAPGAARVRLLARPPGPLRVVLVPEAVLEVEVPALLGGRMQATVELRDADGRPYPVDVYGELVYSGHRRIDGLPAGVWTVEVTTLDGRTFTGTAVTTAGQMTRVVLE